MRAAGSPLLREGARVYFSQPTILRSYLLLPCVLTVAALVGWPEGSLESALRAGSAANPFSVVSLAFLLLLVYLAGRYGAEDYAPESLASIRDYVTMTPTPVRSLVAGKVVFAFLHTAFMLALGAPFLLVALTVSGSRQGALGTAFAVLAGSALASRMYGLFLLSLLGPRKLLRSAAFVGGAGAYLLVTFLVFPSISPAAALLALGSPAPTPGSRLVLLADAGAMVVFIVGAGLVLLAARRARRRGGAKA